MIAVGPAADDAQGQVQLARRGLDDGRRRPGAARAGAAGHWGGRSAVLGLVSPSLSLVPPVLRSSASGSSVSARRHWERASPPRPPCPCASPAWAVLDAPAGGRWT